MTTQFGKYDIDAARSVSTMLGAIAGVEDIGHYIVKVDRSLSQHITRGDAWDTFIENVVDMYQSKHFAEMSEVEAKEHAVMLAQEANTDTQAAMDEDMTYFEWITEDLVDDYTTTFNEEPPAFEIQLTGDLDIIEPGHFMELWKELQKESDY